MSVCKTFSPEVAKAIFDYTKEHPRDPNAELAESVWGFGFTKDSPRKIFSLTKMFLACPHIVTGKNIYYGFTIYPGKRPGDGPLDFRVKIWQQTADEKVKNIGESEWSLANIEGIPNMIANAVHNAKEPAKALHLAHYSNHLQ